MGSLILGDRTRTAPADQPDVGLVVRDEEIRSPQDATIPITGGSLVLHPLNPETGYTFVELPGGPAASAVLPGNIVQLTYDPGVTTDIVMAAAVLADPASALLLVIPGATGLVMPAGLGGTGGNLWQDLIAVPGAMYRRDPTTGHFVPWDGSIVGGAAMLAALVAIQANTSPDNRIDPQTIDLTAGVAADTALGLAGRNLYILGLTGAASIRLVNGGVPYPTAPAPAMDIYPTDAFNFDFTDILLTAAPQPGKILTLAAMWRV